ncbi:aminotransferase class III-fold pyridoxal phosphate-dependent enzyme [Brevibacterium sp. 'Marine']|uniref:aminotransferase family protein n=1 Tax=Brevibacterium sp. 'Marine' TaxID=2725563 RepID=UPI00145D47FE|nr:aminotransferase class III-fold pyridoxal phosphate-dependent enzyme [Brevibacterium sp. 'Marine']
MDGKSGSALLKPVVDGRYRRATRGRGVRLFDDEGNSYLDGSSGAMTANIGHGRPEIAAALQAQAKQLAFSYRSQFTNVPAEELAHRITALAPGDLNYAFFVNSGSEASEYAIRTAVSYWQRQQRHDKTTIVSRHVSYHGMSMGALSMSGHNARRPDYGDLLHRFPNAPAAHAYRFAKPGETEAEYADRAAYEFESAIEEFGAASVAGIIVEPIVGAAGGVLVPPRGYLRRLREICDRHEVLFIVDEVITGMGRTGEWFACHDEGIVPDILLLGKGLSAGYTPVAGALLREHIVDVFRSGTGTAPFGHTFSGNPLGAAACLAVLDVMDNSHVLGNVRARGRQLEDGLQSLQKRYDFIDDVRGRGLLWGFEFVLDRTNRQPPKAECNASTSFTEICFAKGLVVYPAGIAPLNNAVIVAPPLTITADEIRELLELLDDALSSFEPVIEKWRAAATPTTLSTF